MRDKEGRFVILDASQGSNIYTIVNLYAPNNDDPGFIMKISEQIDNVGNDLKIIGGDFSLVLDLDNLG